MQEKNNRKTTVPRKRKTPFGEHYYLILIDINIIELATVLIGGYEFVFYFIRERHTHKL